jgi:hypothetical protein
MAIARSGPSDRIFEAPRKLIQQQDFGLSIGSSDIEKKAISFAY